MELNSSPKEEANNAVKKKQHYAVALKPKVIELSQEDLEHLAEWLALKHPQKTKNKIVVALLTTC